MEHSKFYLEVLEFVKDNTKIFDESHNWIHAVNVTRTAHEIMNSLGVSYEQEIITIAALCHDLCDHKYQESISVKTLEEFSIKMIGPENTFRVLDIIENVSFSKEIKGLRKSLSDIDNVYLMAISDADRLEAIGLIGIKRCEIFSHERGKKVPEDVIKHCYEKLLRLLPENFIKSDYARKLAIPLHQEILDYVSKYDVNN